MDLKNPHAELLYSLLREYKFKVHDKNTLRWGIRMKVEWIKEARGDLEPHVNFQTIEIYEDGSIVTPGLGMGCYACPGQEFLIEYFVLSFFSSLRDIQKEKNEGN